MRDVNDSRLTDLFPTNFPLPSDLDGSARPECSQCKADEEGAWAGSLHAFSLQFQCEGIESHTWCLSESISIKYSQPYPGVEEHASYLPYAVGPPHYAPCLPSDKAGASVLTDRRWIAERRPAMPCRVGSFITPVLAKRRKTLFLVSVDRPESRRVCQAVTTRSRSASRQVLREPVPLTREFTVQQLCIRDEGYMRPTPHATVSACSRHGPSRIR